MAGNAGNSGGRRESRWRIALAWTTAALNCCCHLSRCSSPMKVVWDVADFALFGALLVGAGITYELARIFHQ